VTCNPHWSRTRIPTRRSGPAWRGGDERGEGRGEGESRRLRGEGRAQRGSPLTSLGDRRRRQRPPRGPAVWSRVVPAPPHKETPRTHTPPPRAVTQHRGPGTRPAASGAGERRRRRELPAHRALPHAFSLTRRAEAGRGEAE